MARGSLRSTLLAVAGSVLALGAGQAGAFYEIVVFGDSLSDSGNVYQLTQGYPGNPLLPFPGDERYVGGRQSNGRVGVEFMALSLGVPLANYAQVGATTGTANVWDDGALGELPGALGLSGMMGQVQTYLTQSPPSNPDSLYVLWGGPNDFLSGIADPNFDAGAAIVGALTNLSNEAGLLYLDGARSFLIPNMPDLGLTPRATYFGLSVPATQLSMAFNANLANVLGGLRANFSDASFYGYDSFGRSRDIYAQFTGQDPTAPEFTPYCLLVSDCVVDPALQSEYYFWDDVHPTTQVHSILGREMAAAVPEPETWALVMAGLALVVWSRRRILNRS